MNKSATARNYIAAYEEYLKVNTDIVNLEKKKTELHKKLCDTAGMFLGLSEYEINKVLFYWTSIAEEAQREIDLSA